MKRLLVYGDSNVWGYIQGGARLPEESQWSVILAQKLEPEYRVIQEGLPGRTAGSVDQDQPCLDGQAHFEAILRSALPLDLVIVALGTNDLKPTYKQTAAQIADSLLWYKNLSAQVAGEAKFLFVLPANFAVKEGGMRNELRREVIDEISRRLDADDYVVLDDIELADSVHFSVKGHHQVADIVYSKMSACLH